MTETEWRSMLASLRASVEYVEDERGPEAAAALERKIEAQLSLIERARAGDARAQATLMRQVGGLQ